MKRKTLITILLLIFILSIALFELFQLFEFQEFLNLKFVYLICLIPFFIFPLLRKHLNYWHIIIVAIVIFAGLFRSQLAIHIPNKDDLDFYAQPYGKAEKYQITGIVCDLPDIRENNTKITICSEQIVVNEAFLKVSGKFLATVKHYPEYHYGDRVKLLGKLQLPENNQEFGYKNYLAKNHIYSFVPFAEMELISKNNGNKLIAMLFNLKKRFEENLRQTIPEPESSFAAGILLGSRKQMSQEILDDFKKTGLLHLLALSGFNITIIIVAVFWLLKRFPKKISLTITLLAVTFFVLMVGASASVVRAAVMGLLGLFVLHSGREGKPLYILLIACFFMIAVNPKILLFDVSFQLSIAGVLGLILFVPIFEKINFFKKIPNVFALKEALYITLSAQVMVAPLAAFHFETFSLISPVANPVVAPMIPVAMLLSFVAGLFAFLSVFIARIIGFFAYIVLHIPLKIAEYLADFSYAQIQLKIGVIIFIALYFLIFVLYNSIKKHQNN